MWVLCLQIDALCGQLMNELGFASFSIKLSRSLRGQRELERNVCKICEYEIFAVRIQKVLSTDKRTSYN